MIIVIMTLMTDPIFHFDQPHHQSSVIGELRSPGRFDSVSDGPSSPDTASAISSPSSENNVTTPSVPPLPPHSSTNNTLVKPSHKKKQQKTKVFGAFRSVFRSFPIMSTSCKFPVITSSNGDCHHPRGFQNGTRVTGTLYGSRKGRVLLSVQESPRCFPSVVIELPIQTTTLQKEMGAGMLRIALECEKRPEKEKKRLLEEPLWTMFCNGKKSGYGVRRDPTEEDLMVMQLFRAVSMGAGLIPGSSKVEGADDEWTYFRSQFEHVVGSKDSETLYMLSPEGNYGPELTLFFVRIE